MFDDDLLGDDTILEGVRSEDFEAGRHLTALVPPYRIKLVGRGLSIRSRSMRWSSREFLSRWVWARRLVHERERVMVENPGLSD